MDEIIVKDTTLITSKTDLKGYITYANDDFVFYSGYSIRELIHKNHNIIRHPDMPKAAFKVLWDYIQDDKEFFAFVKNKRKNGGFYWVFTNITPSHNEKGEIIGYYSVRRAPNRKYLGLMSDVYKKVKDYEEKHGLEAGVKELEDIIKGYNMSYNELIFRLQRNEI
ncbi:histidine kinase [Campylobacter sp. MIT 12-8780]|uniref:PAS domain-containing protein n=1 Tax=unclassified Campylobacter TaxID=2593542 RepID=UPI0010F8CEE4|nr:MULTISPECIES: PAS domain-containing protein [unclassified Campylobacter]NDJ26483.1 PAS domain-containing protein [Campylobacter sp. MIT 19-121]TKX29327.1 histidine kinase [Campylobacter sp. MIT 12-5580]TQR43055.1 histidine kinase [Campylobacter sp. MIT 12-8780]